MFPSGGGETTKGRVFLALAEDISINQSNDISFLDGVRLGHDRVNFILENMVHDYNYDSNPSFPIVSQCCETTLLKFRQSVSGFWGERIPKKCFVILSSANMHCRTGALLQLEYVR